MAIKVCLEVLSLLLCVFVVVSKCKKIHDIERKVNILEQKFGIQMFENTLMKEEINNLRTVMSEIIENVTDIVGEKKGQLTYNTDRNSALNAETVDMTGANQEINDLVQLTKSLLYAFKAEKQERTKLTAEIESLRKFEQINTKDLDRLKESLEAIHEDLQIQKNTYKQNKEQMHQEIEDLNVYKKNMEESSIKLKVLHNENAISKLGAAYDKDVSTLETKYSSLLTQIKEMTGKLKLQEVSFSARLSSSIQNLGQWKTVAFDQVITNRGNAYSGQTGMFTAPIPGAYVFYTHILAQDRTLEMCLQKNGSCVLWLFVSGNEHGGDSNMVVLHLKKGDKVNVVKHGPWGRSPYYVHHVWSTFSGYILYSL